MAYINEHLGGINGRPIQFDECEGLSDVSKATDCGNQFVENRDVAVLYATGANTGHVWEPPNKAGIPVFCAGCGLPEMGADRNTFILVNGLAGSLGFPAGYAKSKGVTAIGSLVIGMPAAVEPMVFPHRIDRAE